MYAAPRFALELDHMAHELWEEGAFVVMLPGANYLGPEFVYVRRK